LGVLEEKRTKNYASSKTLPASIKKKEMDTLARSAVRLPHQMSSLITHNVAGVTQ
jgi:hypothetical protein